MNQILTNYSDRVATWRKKNSGQLFMSERGETLCAAHAPYLTDEWTFGHWKKITPAYREMWKQECPDLPLQCESCRCAS